LAAPGGWRRRLRDRRALVGAIVVLVALLVAGATLTLAVFTATSGSPTRISAGDLVFALSPPTTVVNTVGMRPGETRTGVVTLTNQKSQGTFTLSFDGLTASSLATTLHLTVTKTAPTTAVLYSGALASVRPLPLGTITTGKAMTLSLAFVWPAEAEDPALQGQSVSLVLSWRAIT
jgi:hypothetical protein